MLNIVIFTEQDEGLDILAEVVARQKSMATDIGTEIDRQDGMIRQKAYNIIYWYMLYSIYICIIILYIIILYGYGLDRNTIGQTGLAGRLLWHYFCFVPVLTLGL